MGEAPNLNSLRQRQKFPMTLQGLDCHQLKITSTPKWHVLGRPVLNPYTWYEANAQSVMARIILIIIKKGE